MLVAPAAPAAVPAATARPALTPLAVPAAGLETGGLRVSVILPTLNEAANLPFVLPRIPPWVDELVLVDGQSQDGTVAVAEALWPGVKVLSLPPRGKGAALRAGIAAATGDLLVLLDGDGSTDPAEIPAFVGALLAGAELVKGSRFLQGGGTADMSWYRRLGNQALTRLVRLAFGGHYSDLCYGYNALWAGVAARLELDADGFEIETLLNVRALARGLNVVEVASFEAPRLHGHSHLRTIPDGWRVLCTILKERSRTPFRRSAARREARPEAVRGLRSEA